MISIRLYRHFTVTVIFGDMIILNDFSVVVIVKTLPDVHLGYREAILSLRMGQNVINSLVSSGRGQTPASTAKM